MKKHTKRESNSIIGWQILLEAEIKGLTQINKT